MKYYLDFFKRCSNFLRNVKRIYPSATVIPYAVFCVEAK